MKLDNNRKKNIMKNRKDIMTDKNYYIGLSDISFYLTDDDGKIKTDKNGNEITYRLKDGIRYKPLEYITEGIELDMLEKI